MRLLSGLLWSLGLETTMILGTGILVGTPVAAITLVALAISQSGLPTLSISPTTCALILAAVTIAGAAAVLLPA